MMTGAVMVALVAPFLDGTAAPMVVAIAACGLYTLVLALWLFRGGEGSGVAPASAGNDGSGTGCV